MNKQKKTIYTLALDGYAPELTALTFPLMSKYAEKIKADFVVIDKPKFGHYPTYEKFQVYDLCKDRGDDWSLFFDSDTLIHPDMFDVTALLSKDITCSGYSSDFTPLRFRPDEYFMRDGRYLGKGTWFMAWSDWTRDIWLPIEKNDITYEQCVDNMFPINDEIIKIKKTKESLIDDYLVSRNISRFGLKHTTLSELATKHGFQIGATIQTTMQGQAGQQLSPYLQHDYNKDLPGKIIWAEKVLNMWGVAV